MEVNLRQSGESLKFLVRRKPSPFIVYVQKRLCATCSVAASLHVVHDLAEVVAISFLSLCATL
jgi:hypothetical protein